MHIHRSRRQPHRLRRVRDGVAMPRHMHLSVELASIVESQDGVVTIEQLVAGGVSPHTANSRVGRGRWRRLLPGVLLTSSAPPSRRQMLVGAWLHAGPDSAIDGRDACVWHDILPQVVHAAPVHVVAPWTSKARNRGFVVVRRTIAPIPVGGRGIVPYVDAATAVVVAGRDAPSSRDAIALLSRALQTGAVSMAQLREARDQIGDKWCRGVDAALVAVGVGLRSPAEKDAHGWILGSRILPEPKWNQWLDLGDGGPAVCADGLWEEARLVNEVLGREYHAWGERFEATESRRARMIATGLVVQGCTALQIRRSGAVVLDKLERTYQLNVGRGMPPGVTLIDPPRIATLSA